MRSRPGVNRVIPRTSIWSLSLVTMAEVVTAPGFIISEKVESLSIPAANVVSDSICETMSDRAA